MKKAKVNDPIETTDTTPRTKVLSNGAVYDLDRGRIVANPNGGKHAITSDNARDMVRRRVELKRQTVAAAAQDAVQRGDLAGKYGDAAWIAEVTQAQMQLATTPDAGKSSVMAAQWLMDNAGMGERQAQQDNGQPTAGDVAEIVNALASFVATVRDTIPIRQDIDIIDAG